jgi:hypothetical protein
VIINRAQSAKSKTSTLYSVKLTEEELVNLAVHLNASQQQQHDVSKKSIDNKDIISTVTWETMCSAHDNTKDVNHMIYLFISLMGIIVILLMIVGGIVLKEGYKNKHKSTCIDEFNGDGVCDDRQNVEECDYDGLDCCLVSVAIMTSFCEDCNTVFIYQNDSCQLHLKTPCFRLSQKRTLLYQ